MLLRGNNCCVTINVMTYAGRKIINAKNTNL